VTAKERWKATIAGTVHDMMTHLKHHGVGGGQLRHKNNHQNHIDELLQGQAANLKF